ncbi:MAG: hypothetical protein LBB49_03085 [Gracilibacteraceae bacterium]|nr:hypothetical protein [Gracilibacteraceae bacterium]
MYKTGYDTAFAFFYDQGIPGPTMIPGSNYGAMSHDEIIQGQVIAHLTEDDILTMNRIDDLDLVQETISHIGGGTSVTSASIIITKIG